MLMSGSASSALFSPESEHRCALSGRTLHEADLADIANGRRVVSAFHEDDGLAMSAGRLVLAVSRSMIFRIAAQ